MLRCGLKLGFSHLKAKLGLKREEPATQCGPRWRILSKAIAEKVENSNEK